MPPYWIGGQVTYDGGIISRFRDSTYTSILVYPHFYENIANVLKKMRSVRNDPNQSLM